MSPTIRTPLAIAESLTELWSPQVIAAVDDMLVKVAKVRGEMACHSHEHEDELFFVLKGEFVLEFEDGRVSLRGRSVCGAARQTASSNRRAEVPAHAI